MSEEEQEVEETSEAIVKVEVVRPYLSVAEAQERFQQFQELKRGALSQEDLLYIGNTGAPVKNKKLASNVYIKKSGWRKLAVLFNLNTEILHREKLWGQDEHGDYYVWLFHVRVTAPNGRYCDAEGACTSRDPFFAKRLGGYITPNEANIILKAQTVAYNRAISDLIGGGELSAEEIEDTVVPVVPLPEPTQMKKKMHKKQKKETEQHE